MLSKLLEKQNETLEKLYKTLDKYNNNKIKKWNDKSEYHIKSSMHYMYEYATIWGDMKANYHYRLAVYYCNCVRGGKAILDWKKQKEDELNTRK